MKNLLQKITLIALLLFVFQITLTAQPIGSQIKVGTDSHISYWDGVSAWIAIAPGLPGQDLQFVAGVPAWVNNPNGITTTTVTSISGTTAISGGNILSDGGATIIARGVCWSTSPNPTVALTTKTTDGTGIGSFTSSITGLNSGATYYIRAYATNSFGTAYGNEVNIITANFVYDIDGNKYDMLFIGSQIWLKQNLKATHYSNGDTIPNVIDSLTWINQTSGAYCNYNNDTNYAYTYGRLYNYYTVVDPRKICPIGWDVPNYQDWLTLEQYVGGGGVLKESGFMHWLSPNTGATNTYSFTALPGGIRSVDNKFWDINRNSCFWSTTEYNNNINNARYQLLYHNDGGSSYMQENSNKKSGLSVRCVKTQVLTIGQIYQGGIIGYILKPGDPGFDPYQLHGLIVAPNDQSGAEWGCNGNIIGTSIEIGFGQLNTSAIINSCGMSNIAARICNDLVLNGYSDWYLPSLKEIMAMFENKYLLNLTSNYYWTSSECYDYFPNNNSWIYTCGNNCVSASSEKSNITHNVRAIRSF